VGTTVQDSGLLDELEPAFEDATGYELKPIPMGTGQALETGRRGDADVLLVHAPKAEEEFMAEGFGVSRQLVMHNDFIIVGPADDPAGVSRAEDAVTAMHAIRKSEAAFVSRGDDSGTHALELRLWEELGFDPAGESWYSESGQGMGATLQIASQQGAYTISDRGTYLAQRDNIELEMAFEGGAAMLNVYHVMQVNPERFDNLNAEGAEVFVEFMVSDEMQSIIDEFGREQYGRSLFVPDAGKTEAELAVD
jgi:tungstate transport system substrate-binding protein